MTDPRLFKVVSPRFQEPQYFGNKRDAKFCRDELKPANLVIMRGPDHWRGESFNRNLNPTPSSKGPAW